MTSRTRKGDLDTALSQAGRDLEELTHDEADEGPRFSALEEQAVRIIRNFSFVSGEEDCDDLDFDRIQSMSDDIPRGLARLIVLAYVAAAKWGCYIDDHVEWYLDEIYAEVRDLNEVI